jgi:hypothetical protein
MLTFDVPLGYGVSHRATAFDDEVLSLLDAIDQEPAAWFQPEPMSVESARSKLSFSYWQVQKHPQATPNAKTPATTSVIR